MSARLIVYIAVSADGFIATPDGGIEWLARFDASRYGTDEFVASVGAIVMGRKTFDQVAAFPDWPYPGKRVLVLTSRPLPPTPVSAACERYSDIGRLIEVARAVGRDVWIEGGGQTIGAFLERDAVDEFDLFMIPVLLGDGIRLLSGPARIWPLSLHRSHVFPDGVIRLTYRLARA